MTSINTVNQKIPQDTIYEVARFFSIPREDFLKIDEDYQRCILDLVNIESNDTIQCVEFYRYLLKVGTLTKWLCKAYGYDKDNEEIIVIGNDEVEIDGKDVLEFIYQVVKAGGSVDDDCGWSFF